MSSSESTLMMILTHQFPSLTTAPLRNIIQFLLYSKHLLYYIIIIIIQFLLYSKHLLYYIINVSPHMAK